MEHPELCEQSGVGMLWDLEWKSFGIGLQSRDGPCCSGLCRGAQTQRREEALAGTNSALVVGLSLQQQGRDITQHSSPQRHRCDRSQELQQHQQEALAGRNAFPAAQGVILHSSLYIHQLHFKEEFCVWWDPVGKR